jgi:endonuclease-3
MVLRKEEELREIKRRFLTKYPQKKTELKYQTPYQLLVAIILSAQCTDKRVNQITPHFFKKFPTIYDLASAKFDEVKGAIASCSYPNNKAKNLIGMAKKVVEEFGGEIPTDHKLLITLPGVGNKTANVFLIEYLGENRMAVDTHVFRVVHRLGITDAPNVGETERDLVEAFQTDLGALHHAFVLFGRYICKATKPDCQNCFVSDFCVDKGRFKAR